MPCRCRDHKLYRLLGRHMICSISHGTFYVGCVWALELLVSSLEKWHTPKKQQSLEGRLLLWKPRSRLVCLHEYRHTATYIKEVALSVSRCRGISVFTMPPIHHGLLGRSSESCLGSCQSVGFLVTGMASANRPLLFAGTSWLAFRSARKNVRRKPRRNSSSRPKKKSDAWRPRWDSLAYCGGIALLNSRSQAWPHSDWGAMQGNACVLCIGCTLKGSWISLDW